MEEYRQIENVMVSNYGNCNKKLYLNDGYLKAYQNSKGIHILVAKAFPEICGEWFEGCHVHHKDHNPLNNRADNLQIMTAKDHIKLHRESEITKKRKANKGEKNGFFGKHHSEETKEKLSKLHSGMKESEETKRKIGEARKGKKHNESAKRILSEKHKKKTIVYDKQGNVVAEFNSLAEAAKFVGRSYTTLISNIQGKTKYCNGFIIKYKRDTE